MSEAILVAFLIANLVAMAYLKWQTEQLNARVKRLEDINDRRAE